MNPPLSELVVCSLEPWDDVWRRNQFFVDALLKRNQRLRVLFVEPAADVLFDLRNRRVPTLPRLRQRADDGRLRAFRPLKPLPRKMGRVADDILLAQVRLAAHALRFSRPTLWINDVTYAPLIASTGWPSLYDVTDDWLLAPFPPREVQRLRHLDELALAASREVVVCSQALADSRSAGREVTLVPNGVDVDHFRRQRPRPRDLPDGSCAIYVGSLHEARLDIELVVELASSQPSLHVVLVGPNSLGSRSLRLLDTHANIVLLGARPYADIPAYLQHADVVVVPHVVSPFTESLDPIKAYECLVVDTPTVATPVAGFRELSEAVDVVDRGEFARRVGQVLFDGANDGPCRPVPVGWQERAATFEFALLRAGSASRAGVSG